MATIQLMLNRSAEEDVIQSGLQYTKQNIETYEWQVNNDAFTYIILIFIKMNQLAES